MKRRSVIQHGAAVCAAWGMPALAAPTRNTNTIVLGQSVALSGPAAQLGIQMNHGARLYLDGLNASGGVNGHVVELRALDDGYEPERCKVNTDRFINEGVFALFGYVGTPTCLAALPLVQESVTPFFGPFTGAEALRNPFHKAVFHLRASYYDETALIVKQLLSFNLAKIAVFYQNDSYGKAGLEGVMRALQPRDLKPVALGTVERNTVEVTQAVKDILASSPDAIVQIGAYKACAAFIRAARRAGYVGTFYNVSFVGTQALADELKRDGDGVVVTQVMPYPFSTKQNITREYLSVLRATGRDATPNYSSIEGYLAAKVFCEGLRRAGRNPSSAGLFQALESMQHIDFGGFHVNFGPKNHVASRFVDLSMLTADGRVRH